MWGWVGEGHEEPPARRIQPSRRFRSPQSPERFLRRHHHCQPSAQWVQLGPDSPLPWPCCWAGLYGSVFTCAQATGSRVATEGQRGSCRVTEGHGGSQRVTGRHGGSQRVIEGHRGSQRTTEGHRGTQRTGACDLLPKPHVRGQRRGTGASWVAAAALAPSPGTCHIR